HVYNEKYSFLLSSLFFNNYGRYRETQGGRSDRTPDTTGAEELEIGRRGLDVSGGNCDTLPVWGQGTQ
ncbi:MAG: hypothetical protein LDL33_15845, partial [Desulfomonile sp.]|nr:hypothetical protein [Desulfomonile sp.]